MGPSLRAVVMTLIAGLLLPANAYAQAQQQVEPQPRNPIVAGLGIGFDAVILRPLGLVAVAVGTAAFVPAALLTAPNGRDGIQSALGILVTERAKSVFQRRLGDF
jgi:hypothetical protein